VKQESNNQKLTNEIGVLTLTRNLRNSEEDRERADEKKNQYKAQVQAHAGQLQEANISQERHGDGEP
jgi:hypothetical protein